MKIKTTRKHSPTSGLAYRSHPLLGEPNSDADYREDPNVTSFHPSRHVRTSYTSVLHLPGGRQGYTYKAMHGLTWLRLSCDTRGHIASISVHQWSLALVSTQMRNVRCHGWLISDQYTPQKKHFRVSERPRTYMLKHGKY
jgi:hypothetical protein